MATGHARPFQPRPNNSDASWLNRPLVERARYLRLFAQELHKVRRGSRTGGVYGPQCSASAFHRRSPAVAADRHHSGVGLCVDRNMPCLQVARDDLHDRPRQTGRLPIADARWPSMLPRSPAVGWRAMAIGAWVGRVEGAVHRDLSHARGTLESSARRPEGGTQIFTPSRLPLPGVAAGTPGRY